jgi:hypothetical protein
MAETAKAATAAARSKCVTILSWSYEIAGWPRIHEGSSIQPVMPGLAPGIHADVAVPAAWMAGTSAAMTAGCSRFDLHHFTKLLQKGAGR